MRIDSYIVVIPAYGRDYRSARAARADWTAGKDFKLAFTGQYCSCRDFTADNTIEIRYKNLARLTIV